jgi:hypothetical protein
MGTMERSELLELVAHYAVLFVLVLIVLSALRSRVGTLDFWTELVVIVGVVFAYRPVVLRLGVAPSAWEE